MPAALNLDFREHWRDLKRGRPGKRFQQRYERARREERAGGAVKRLALIGAAFVCLAIAVVLSVIPGPAIPFYFLAGGLLATESRFIAKLMDWFEVKFRLLLAWGKKRWKRMPTWGRVIAGLVVASFSAGLTYLTYRFVRG
jgi:hypothetical protein